MITDFHFLRPLWLLGLLIPPAILWMASRSGDIRRRWKTMIAPHLLDGLVIEPDRVSHTRPAQMLAAMLAIAALGAAGPTWKREAPPFVSDTASLVIAVDLSPTMDAVDISPSRIERVKLKIHDILSTRNGARTAVIAYSGTAHLVVPLTDDIDLIENYTDALATGIMPKPGKDTTAALKLADGLLTRDGTAGTIVLLTDGIEPGAASAASDISSSLVVLGVGTTAGGVVKQTGGGFLQDAGGAHLNAKLDVDAIKQFGSDTGADVATITDDDSDVQWLAERVQTNFAQQNASEGDRWHDLGWWLIAPVALLFALSFRRGWVVKVAGLLLVLRVIAPSPSQAGELADMWLTADQQGRVAFERGDYAAASERFRDPMWKGVALYRAARYQDALDAFAAVDTQESWYNQGNALLHLGEFEDAISAYSRALKGRSDWPDAAANLAIAQRLLKLEKDKEQEQQQDPNEKADSVQFDNKGKKGKAGEVDVVQQTSETWMKNIQVSPADLMARKFSIEAGKTKQ
ncbi:VWA domain-containing protein [Neorhizobium sp. P12A]|uniref:vWA domain-containing protein n=1 Tax=Neorhizobium sp. P12A TaxID=2268027 RepID=UPI0011EF090C|nr:VWA domain-containing protein [Neorhizobium sp. P12A]KAA0694406.1 VWA domain-containing protein [Neorhizobium sp. P12A]